MYFLRLLGGVALEDSLGAAPESVVQQRALALLALLAVARDKGLGREKLVGLLWPDSSPDRARHRLADTLYMLRKSLGDDSVISAGDTLRLNPEAVLSDVRGFLDALDARELESAVERYGGPFLEGFRAGGAPEFERWADAQCQELANRYAQALEVLGIDAKRSGDHRKAVEWWRLLCAHDPYNSRTALELVEALVAAGDTGNALLFAGEHERFLKEELDTDPDPDFIAAVAELRNASPKARRAVAVPAKGEREPTRVEAGASDSAAMPRRGIRRGRTRAVVLAIGTMSLLALTYVVLRAANIAPFGLAGDGIAPVGRVVLADFDNHTDDPTLSLAVTEGLRIDLSQSRTVQLADQAFVASILRRMQRAQDEPLDEEAAREVAIREGLKAVIAGEVSGAGTRFSLTARLLVAESGEVLAAIRETAENPDDVVVAIDRLASRLRRASGESLKSIGSSKPLEQVTTSSLEALQQYSQSVRVFEEGRGIERSVEFLEAAIDLDPTFAAARLELGRMLIRYATEERVRGVHEITAAYQARDRLAQLEHFEVKGLYYYYVTNELDKAIRAYRNLVELSDSSSRNGLRMLAIMYYNLGDMARSESLGQKVLDLYPLSNANYHNLFLYQFHQGKFDAAEATLDKWTVYNPNSVTNPLDRATLAIHRGDFPAAQRHTVEMKEVWPIERPGRYWTDPDRRLGHLAALQGRLRQAADYYDVAIREMDLVGADRPCLVTTFALAMLDIWFRADPEAGIAKMEAALQRHPLDSLPVTARPYLELAHLHAAAGRPDHARSYLERFHREVDPIYVPTWEEPNELSASAALALAEGRYRDVIELARAGMRRTSLAVFLPMLAQAYEALGEADSAIATYERYVDTPIVGRVRVPPNGIGVVDAYWWPTSYLRLARLHEQRGNTTSAIHYYSKFADLWMNADPELQHRVAGARRAIESLSRPG